MIIRLLSMVLAACWFAAGAPASAHPHVWVTMSSELVYAPDGSMTGVRHAWIFDDMFSAYATQGLDAKKAGEFTREELAPLAKENVEALKEYSYFNYAKVDGKRQKDAFTNPIDYWLEYDPKDTVLTLHFTLPLKTPLKAKAIDIEVYDPEFFVDFGFAEKNPVTLVSAPAQCTVALAKPHDASFSPSFRLDKSFMASEENAGMGASFANKISVKCP